LYNLSIFNLVLQAVCSITKGEKDGLDHVFFFNILVRMFNSERWRSRCTLKKALTDKFSLRTVNNCHGKIPLLLCSFRWVYFSTARHPNLSQ